VRPSVRDRPEFIWAFAPAVATFLVVGRLAGPPGHFAWDPASISGTGVATATLAYFTARLAASTSVDVAATRELAKIESARFAKEDEPHVVNGSARFDQDGRVVVEIVNVGRGPAVNVRWEAFFVLPPGMGEYQPPGELDHGEAGAIIGGGWAEARIVPWAALETPGRYGVRGVHSDRHGIAMRTFGPAPARGWDAWLEERATDPWWRMTGGTPPPSIAV
jgi:hypothetical protein